MTAIDVLAIPVDSRPDLSAGGPDRYDYNRLPDHLRPAAMTAQGTVVEGLTSAVRRVLDAGQALAWAKSELPHGEYLPWVQQACGLKPQRAAELIRAAEWVQMSGTAGTLMEVGDADTLFILSAKTTTEEVREWFMERCAAGDPPTRKEVQERKRSAGQPRQPQPTETLALSIIRKGAEELERMRRAIALAERAQLVTAAAVMAEQRLRDLGKQRFIPGADADFHRMKDGSWVRLPHAAVPEPASDPISEPEPEQESAADESAASQPHGELMTVERAAERLGLATHYLTNQLTPSAAEKRGGPFIRNGLVINRDQRGLVRVKPIGL